MTYDPPLRLPDDARLLDTWDRAVTLDRPWRELAVLASATGMAMADAARLSVGERDRQLLLLRINAFGTHLECETWCPACAARLELAIDARSLLVPARERTDGDDLLSDDGVAVRLRLPDSTDLAALHNSTDAERTLGDRCMAIVATSDERGGLPASPDVVPSDRLRARVAERMAELDPQADVELSLTCAACAHRWASPFDPAAFLLSEVNSYVARLTGDVHQLARAYGWTESSILAMSALRRRRYLSLIVQ